MSFKIFAIYLSNVEELRIQTPPSKFFYYKAFKCIALFYFLGEPLNEEKYEKHSQKGLLLQRSRRGTKLGRSALAELSINEHLIDMHH